MRIAQPTVGQGSHPLARERYVRRTDKHRDRRRRRVAGQPLEDRHTGARVLHADIEDHGVGPLVLDQLVRARAPAIAQGAVSFRFEALGDHTEDPVVVLNDSDQGRYHAILFLGPWSCGATAADTISPHECDKVL